MAKKPKQFTNVQMCCNTCGFVTEIPAADASKFNGSKCWKCNKGHIFKKGTYVQK